MNPHRRSMLAAPGTAPIAPPMNGWPTEHESDERLMLSNFQNGYMLPDVGWRGFSDRVMGGVSNAELNAAQIAGKNCIRLSGNVTRESNGGFIQMALYFGKSYDALDGSAYKGIEMLVHGNNEDYNLHVRTADCRWYDQSYRTTFFAAPEWQRIRVPWEDFDSNRVDSPLDAASLQRIALVGWMREFEADISLAEISLYA